MDRRAVGVGSHSVRLRHCGDFSILVAACAMKLRRKKHREHRHIDKALRSIHRELGDHRRWWWMATMPIELEADPVLGKCTVFFDPKFGRLYRYERGFSAYLEE
jgi:hypothetical protein